MTDASRRVTDASPHSQRVWADNAWVDGWAGPSVFTVTPDGFEFQGPTDGIAPANRGAHLPGTILPGFTDSHVHLGLTDAATLRANGIARVLDLGWDPREAQRWAADSADPARLDVSFAGAFLTAPGGYPSTRDWAPPAAVREINEADVAAAAIAEMAAAGATLIKITLNSDAGPVWGDDLLAETVRIAHAAALPVVAHAQGPGQALRAALAGVDLLAHTPFTERLDDEVIALLAARCGIISTLDIHGYGEYGEDLAIATHNLTRFAAAGGRVLYGTDLGNGPLIEGINERELAALLGAGLSPQQVVTALIGPAVASATPSARTPSAPALSAATHASAPPSRVSWIPGPRVSDPTNFARWLATASVVTAHQLEEIAE